MFLAVLALVASALACDKIAYVYNPHTGAYDAVHVTHVAPQPQRLCIGPRGNAIVCRQQVVNTYVAPTPVLATVPARPNTTRVAGAFATRDIDIVFDVEVPKKRRVKVIDHHHH